MIGPLVKRFGEQRLTLAGLGLVLVGCLMIPLAPVERSQSVVFPAVALLAFGTGLVTPSLRSLVSRRLSSGGKVPPSAACKVCRAWGVSWGRH